MTSYSMEIQFGETITSARFAEVEVAFEGDEEDDPKHSISIYSNTWEIGPTSKRDHRVEGGTLYAWDISDNKGEQLLELAANIATPSVIPEVGEDSKSAKNSVLSNLFASITKALRSGLSCPE